jgi:hypothetical protein
MENIASTNWGYLLKQGVCTRNTETERVLEETHINNKVVLYLQ